jgi:hypothetical protein
VPKSAGSRTRGPDRLVEEPSAGDAASESRSVEVAMVEGDKLVAVVPSDLDVNPAAIPERPPDIALTMSVEDDTLPTGSWFDVVAEAGSIFTPKLLKPSLLAFWSCSPTSGEDVASGIVCIIVCRLDSTFEKTLKAFQEVPLC